MKNTLRIRRAERRWSQIKLARRARLPEKRYWRIENELTEPTGDDIDALSKALNVPAGALFPELEAVLR